MYLSKCYLSLREDVLHNLPGICSHWRFVSCVLNHYSYVHGIIDICILFSAYFCGEHCSNFGYWKLFQLACESWPCIPPPHLLLCVWALLGFDHWEPLQACVSAPRSIVLELATSLCFGPCFPHFGPWIRNPVLDAGCSIGCRGVFSFIGGVYLVVFRGYFWLVLRALWGAKDCTWDGWLQAIVQLYLLYLSAHWVPFLLDSLRSGKKDLIYVQAIQRCTL